MTQQLRTVETELTKLLGIKYPIFLAGMDKSAGSKLAAAVTNAGGLGVIGGAHLTPRILKLTIQNLKKDLIDPNGAYGVDLLLPKLGGNSRKTNYDYTKGNIDELIDIIINCGGCKLFVSAIGVCPKNIVDKMHRNNILVMNMIGHPKHVTKCLKVGVDILCAQGSEAGGHTGNIATSILLPKCVDLVHGHKMTLYPKTNIQIVGAGGIYDGRGVAMAINYGCSAVWVGTRFVASKESGASLAHKKAIINAKYEDAKPTLVYSGRPLRTLQNEYIRDWETKRSYQMKELLKRGIIPKKFDDSQDEKPKLFGYQKIDWYHAGQVVGNIDHIKYAKDIINDMMEQCVQVIKMNRNRIRLVAKL